MNNTTKRSNVNKTWELLQIYLQKTVLENFEPNLYFYKMGEKPMWEDGYNTIAWTRYNRLVISAEDSQLVESVTPEETAFNTTTISVSPIQYWLYVVLSDMLLDVAPVDLIGWAAKEVGMNMARIIDEAIQSNLLANNLNTIYASDDHSSRVTLDATDTLKAKYLNQARTFLTTQSAPDFNGYYVAHLHPNVAYDLREETSVGGWLDSRKYAQPENIFKWEIGAINWVRVIESPFVKRVQSTVVVYPTYVMGRWAYWVATLQNLKAYKTPRTASDSDPLAQRVKVWSKVAFNTKILQAEALVIIESASSQAFNSEFNPAPTA